MPCVGLLTTQPCPFSWDPPLLSAPEAPAETTVTTDNWEVLEPSWARCSFPGFSYLTSVKPVGPVYGWRWPAGFLSSGERPAAGRCGGHRCQVRFGSPAHQSPLPSAWVHGFCVGDPISTPRSEYASVSGNLGASR